ncbi:winged helix-turn-helix domain-containing protein [Vibrio sp. 404]|uniref:Winged helix-turn-helix domain-containing protein n=1 Tax=Vibrio marinisediminis TaxID=2758441 RepID=A0A7W2FNC3_9VIBR|nr:winged helix-turn-helix domain-containing protein [Vibrio marinisediminis]MBA5761276.1 winged helix-turn-helix domain-containing protein [Vibrio marinisediminis]
MTQLSLEPPVYQIGDIYYSPTSGVIKYQGESTRLRAREANLFHALVLSFPDVLSRTKIEETLWKDSYATNATINQTVKALRFSLQDDQRILIRTIPKQGYVLAVKPKVIASDETTDEQVTESDSQLLKDEHVAAIAPQHQLFSSSFLATVFLLGTAAFALGASGQFASKYAQLSHQYNQHWILFTPEQGELEKLPLQAGNPTKYVIKSDSYYKICEENQGELRCKTIEF